jgi:hypothetical protein
MAIAKFLKPQLKILIFGIGSSEPKVYNMPKKTLTQVEETAAQLYMRKMEIERVHGCLLKVIKIVGFNTKPNAKAFFFVPLFKFSRQQYIHARDHMTSVQAVDDVDLLKILDHALECPIRMPATRLRQGFQAIIRRKNDHLI